MRLIPARIACTRTIIPRSISSICDLCGPDLLQRDRKGQIYIQDKPFRYPPSAFDIMTAFGLKDFARFSLGFLMARMGRFRRSEEPDNFEDYTTSMVGKSLYERFYKPYAIKLYGMSPRAIAKDPAVSRVRKFKLAAMLRDVKDRITGKQKKTYLYPANGIGQLATALKEKFLNNGGRLVFISQLDSLRIKDDRMIESVDFRTQDGTYQELAVDKFVSTISLDILHGMVCLEADEQSRGTDQGFSSSNEHLESNTTRVFFIVSFPRIDSKPSPYLSRSSKTRCDSRSP